MQRIKLAPLLCCAFLIACLPGRRQPAAADLQFVARDCAPALAAVNANCGSVFVPEDYARPGGRRIGLNVIVFPATEPGRERAAQFDLEGGPGYAVTDYSPGFYATDGAAYRQYRDVVLIDMRGTGASHPLRCSALEEHQKSQPLAPLYPPELVVECASTLSAKADLRQYSTANASRDLDAVRSALGYEKIDLNALSYGTTLALRYIADYPQHVRSAVLTGTIAADRTPPAHHAAAAERGLQLLFDACAADAACAARYPQPWADLDRAIERLDSEHRAVFLERLRSRLYLPATARSVPSILRAVAGGNLDFLAGSADGRVFADGVYLSITCSESLARMDVERAIAESDATHFGSYRLQRQREACRHWPIAAADPKLFRTGRYEVPVLFLSGALDPVTPVAWTLEVSRMFPHSQHVVVPQGGHVLEGLTGMDTCIDAMILEFVATPSTARIDPSCVAAMDGGPFP